MRFVLLIVVALLFSPARAEARTWNAAELEGLLAPVALHPDPVLLSVLDASLVPHEVLDAARAGGSPGPWSQPVQTLTAYPDLLARMAESKQWLFDLGDAWLGQRNDVLAAVGVLRQRAAATGHPVMPAQVIHYDPVVVYGPVWRPAYHVVRWRPWVPAHVHHHHFHVHRPAHHVHRHVHRELHPHRNGPPSPAARLQQHQATQFRQYHRIPEAQRKPIVQQHYPRFDAARGHGHGHGNRGNRF